MKKHLITTLATALAITCLPAFAEDAPAAAPAAPAGKPAQIKVDHRGLVEVSGVLKDKSGAHWGASNLIVKPFGSWAAQDFALKAVKKVKKGPDFTITADFNTNPKAQLLETINIAEPGKAKVVYKLTSASGKPANYEQIMLQFPVGTKEFAGAEVTTDNGAKLKLDGAEGDTIEIPEGAKSITLSSAKAKLTISSPDLAISLRDARPERAAYLVVLTLPESQGATEYNFSYDISGSLL